jgi:hypothetical protein
MGEEARFIPMDWNDGKKEYACVECDDEPWGLGVWDWFEGDSRPIPDPSKDDGYGSTYTKGALNFLKERTKEVKAKAKARKKGH